MFSKKMLFRRIFAILLCIVGVLAVTSCKKCNEEEDPGEGGGGGGGDNPPATEVISNETTPLRISTLDLDGVFSPFYSTSGTDSSVVGMTQIGMLGSTPDGQYSYGDNEAVVAKDVAYKYYDETGKEISTGDTEGSTVYQFVIKNGIKFSDGTPLTMHDVLFSLYLLLDPAYTGSSTVYSTDIKGLNAYRQQNPLATDDSNDGFNETFAARATERLNSLIKYVSSESNRKNFTTEQVAEIKSDIKQLSTYFKGELNTDYASCANGLEDYQKDYVVTEAWEMFLLYEGVVSYVVDAKGDPIKDDQGRYYPDTEYLKEEFNAAADKKQYAIDLVYNYYMGGTKAEADGIWYENKNIASVASGFVSATELYNYLVAEEKTEFFQSLKEQGGLLVKNVSGITVVKGSEFFGEADYSDDYEVLQIAINGIDPKAIWNFGFTVAPMHYYSDAEHTAAALADTDYSESFGVEFGDSQWYTNVVRSKNNAPMGAGPYKMSTAEGIEGKTQAQIVDGFYKDNMVYFERNDSFLLGKPTIKYIRYKVINANSIMDSLISGDIDFADPSATQYNISQVTANSSYLSQTMVRTNGYGYIGVNPTYVKNINIRKAIMYAMDLSYIKDYYPGDLSQEIYRSMSLVSWVYNYTKDGGSKWTPNPFYQSDFDDPTGTIENINYYVELAGYQRDTEGKWYTYENGKTVYLEYTFTIAGDSEDHPAYRTMEEAAKLLNANGWDITLKTDPDALKKLSSGTLAVWAAAWSSAIDPDMYQVYHMDSTASSTLNWGYTTIKNNTDLYEEEWELIQKLSEKIDAGRETLNEKERALIYQEALDIVMELAVELPIYQRNDMYVYNTTRIDTSTLIQPSECTPYYGPLAEIWNVSLKETNQN